MIACKNIAEERGTYHFCLTPVREITPALEDSGSNSFPEGSSNMLFNSFIQIHSGMSDFYKSNRPHIKTVSINHLPLTHQNGKYQPPTISSKR